MPEAPPPRRRRSIYDTLKQAAPDRLGLADAAALAAKVSRFPVRVETGTSASLHSLGDPVLRPGELNGSVEPVSSPGELDSPLGQTSRTDIPDIQQGQTFGTDIQDRQTGQTNGTDKKDSPKRVSQKSVQQDSPLGQTKRTVQEVCPESVSNRTDKKDSPGGQSTRTDIQDIPLGHSVVLLPPRGVARTGLQKKVWAFLAGMPDMLTSWQGLSEHLKIPRESLRKILRLFESKGMIRKTRVGNEGMRLVCIAAAGSVQDVCPISMSNRTVQQDMLLGQSNPPLKIDREKKDLSLSFSEELMLLNWPTLVTAGFGPDQVRQVAEALAAAGRDAGQVRAGLDRAEWELAQGAMTDKAGAAVADPAAWVFKSLARTGTYRRPKGYISPEEQAARDEEAEATAVIEARRKADAARFEAWRLGLEGEELEAAMRGFPGGSKDRWLRTVWDKRRTAYPTGRE